jgi:hypothetical protein
MSSTDNTMSAINISGMLKNMLREGFSTIHCLIELIDDSQCACASIIHISIDSKKNILILSDNGIGMDRDKLKTSHCFHSRSIASNKHGRFGIGRKHALVQFTQLKGSSTTVSLSKEDMRLSQLNIDFPEVIKTNSLTLYSHGIEETIRPIWDKYAVDKDNSGTMTYLQCDATVLKTLIDMSNSTNIDNSLFYKLGTTYHHFLSNGGKIIISVDDEPRNVYEIDRLYMDSNPNNIMTEHCLDIYYDPTNTSDTRAYYKEKYVKSKKDEIGYGKIENNRYKFVPGNPPTEFIKLGNVTLQCVYTVDGIAFQEENLINNGITIPNSDSSDANCPSLPAFEHQLGGTDLTRNDKIITIFPPTKPKSGDTEGYKYTEKARFSIRYNVLEEGTILENDDVYTQDDVFAIEVNKSRVDEKLIHSNIWKTILEIQKKFSSDCYKRLDPKQIAKQTKTAEVLVPEPTEEFVDASSEPSEPSEIFLDTLIVDILEQPKPKPKLKRVTKLNPDSIMVKDIQPKEDVISNTSTIKVGSHERGLSKTPKDLLILFRSIVAKYNIGDLDRAIETASTTVENGILAKYRNLADISETIDKYYSVTM